MVNFAELNLTVARSSEWDGLRRVDDTFIFILFYLIHHCYITSLKVNGVPATVPATSPRI